MKFKPFLFFAVLAFGSSASFSSAATVLSDAFTYADGALVGAAGSPWVSHSGTAGQVNVASGTAILTGSETEDVNSAFSGGVVNTGTLSSTFTVNFSALPTATTYFAHYKDAANGFTARLFSTVTGATTGSFRLGISNSTNTAAFSTVDLSLNTAYTITLNLDLDANVSSFSINGGSLVTATDAAVDLSIGSFALRQSTGIGTLAVDNLTVDHAVPEPAASFLGAIGLLGILRRRR